MICPQCQGEYREGFATCATCEIALIPGEKHYDHENAGGTPAVLAGLLIAFASMGMLALRMAHATWPWYLGFVGIGIVIYLIRNRFSV
jgi:uncharacterized protein (DUF983 family)